MEHIYYQSPIGTLFLESNGTGLTALRFAENEAVSNAIPQSPLLQEACRQLDAYFAGARQTFDIPLALEGTGFRQKVWQALATIPYGATASYRQVAENIGNAKAVRAIGNANHHNPVSIIVPCHRVIGKGGKMVGYAGGVWRKEWLLAHEQKVA